MKTRSSILGERSTLQRLISKEYTLRARSRQESDRVTLPLSKLISSAFRGPVLRPLCGFSSCYVWCAGAPLQRICTLRAARPRVLSCVRSLLLTNEKEPLFPTKNKK